MYQTMLQSRNGKVTLGRSPKGPIGRDLRARGFCRAVADIYSSESTTRVFIWSSRPVRDYHSDFASAHGK